MMNLHRLSENHAARLLSVVLILAATTVFLAVGPTNAYASECNSDECEFGEDECYAEDSCPSANLCKRCNCTWFIVWFCGWGTDDSCPSCPLEP